MIQNEQVGNRGKSLANEKLFPPEAIGADHMHAITCSNLHSLNPIFEAFSSDHIPALIL